MKDLSFGASTPLPNILYIRIRIPEESSYILLIAMSLRIRGTQLTRKIFISGQAPGLDIPVFLCPGLSKLVQDQVPYGQQRKLHSTLEETALLRPNLSVTSAPTKRLRGAASVNRLPQQCSGCGALSQTIEADEPGYFELRRRSVKQYLSGTSEALSSEEDHIVDQAIRRAKENTPELSKKFGFDIPSNRQSKNPVPLKLDPTKNAKNLYKAQKLPYVNVATLLNTTKQAFQFIILPFSLSRIQSSNHHTNITMYTILLMLQTFQCL